MQSFFKIVFITFITGLFNLVCGGFLYLFGGIAGGRSYELFLFTLLAPLATFVLLSVFCALEKQNTKTLIISLLPIPLSWVPIFFENLKH